MDCCCVQAMYSGAKSKVRVNGSCSGEFEVKVGVHQRFKPIAFHYGFGSII